MNAGKLRERITIQQQSVIQGAYGEVKNLWSTLTSVWAKVEQLKGREYFTSNERHAEVNTRITIRYRSDILPKMRISYKNYIYDIKSIINIDEEDVFMELMCEKLVD